MRSSEGRRPESESKFLICEPAGAKPSSTPAVVLHPPFRRTESDLFKRDSLDVTLHHTKFTKNFTKTRKKKNQLGVDPYRTLPRPPHKSKICSAEVGRFQRPTRPHKKAQTRKPSVCSAEVGRFQRPTRQRKSPKGGQGRRDGRSSFFKEESELFFLSRGAGGRLRRGARRGGNILFADATAVGREAFEYARRRMSPLFLRVCCVREGAKPSSTHAVVLRPPFFGCAA
ncbi:hypothetical protein SDC9_52108 [bioreactor metagenome]|uniref:Uncharacterized protein n=1 Tax=bioreactor metagenome TaxID=1076179 RepID=A0A644WUM8_9ZZZZ